MESAENDAMQRAVAAWQETACRCCQNLSTTFNPKELAMTTLLRHVVTEMHAGRWKEAHDLVQNDESEPAAWLHGILHMQEGDLEDAEYWYGRAGRNFRHRGTLDEEVEKFVATLGPPTP